LIDATGDGKLGRMGLSEREQAILDFERSWWQQPGRKEDGIKERFGLSPSRYHQLVAGLIARREAEDFDPLVVRRLRRARDQRRRARYEGRPARGTGGGRRVT
jgi:hypothetical protein